MPNSANVATSWANNEDQGNRIEVFVTSGELSLRALTGRETDPAKTDRICFYLEQNYIIVICMDNIYKYVGNEVLGAGLPNCCKHWFEK